MTVARPGCGVACRRALGRWHQTCVDADAAEHVGDLTVVDVALTSGPEEQTAR